MSGRRSRRAVALVLVGLLVMPTSVGAQTREIAFSPGVWIGSVFFWGSHETDGVRGDGTTYHDVTTVTASEITFNLAISEGRQVIDGTMTVDIAWVSEGTGEKPVTGDPYHVTFDNRQTGKLAIEGTASRLVASGSLEHEVKTFSDSELLTDETVFVDVEWVFRPAEVTCALVTGRLTEAVGNSLMRTVLMPREGTVDVGGEYINALVSLFRAWPEVENPEAVVEAVVKLNELANEAVSGQPTPAKLQALVLAVEVLRAELARLAACRIAPPGFLAPAGEEWLETILIMLLSKALETPGDYSAQELISLLNTGVRGGAVGASSSDPEAAAQLYEAFGDALDHALDLAIAGPDPGSITDIAMAAAQYGYSDLYQKAVAALSGLSS